MDSHRASPERQDRGETILSLRRTPTLNSKKTAFPTTKVASPARMVDRQVILATLLMMTEINPRNLTTTNLLRNGAEIWLRLIGPNSMSVQVRC